MRVRLIAICALIGVHGLYGQTVEPPSNPLEGRILFEQKGCIECHALGGYGGTSAPDLARQQYFGSFLSLTSRIWNHIPEMNRNYRQVGTPRPRLTETEMLNLAGFLYYLRYLGEPGSVSSGQRLLESKQCNICHGHGERGDLVGPDFQSLQGDVTPISLVQAMWNHAPVMQAEIVEKEVPFPLLSGRDIADISAYLQMATMHDTRTRMSPGDPVAGRDVFERKRCVDCHAVNEGAQGNGPALADMDLTKSVTEIASLMWNHGPDMHEYMLAEDIEWPRFEANEMADVIAYLYFLGFQDTPGDPEEGGVIFLQKGCADCHERGGEGVGPDLATVRRLNSPVRLAQLMWNHASKMEDLLLTKNEMWPKLSASEIRDLLAYLTTNAAKKVDGRE